MNGDIFILKLDINGKFVWVRKIGSTLTDGASSIFYSHHGYLILAGFLQTNGTYTDVCLGNVSIPTVGSYDILLGKIKTRCSVELNDICYPNLNAALNDAVMGDTIKIFGHHIVENPINLMDNLDLIINCDSKLWIKP